MQKPIQWHLIAFKKQMEASQLVLENNCVKLSRPGVRAIQIF